MLRIALLIVCGLFGFRRGDCPNCHRPEPAPAKQVQAKVSDLPPNNIEQKIVDEINVFRKQHGKSALAVDARLLKLARARVNIYSHTAHGKWVWQEAPLFGFNGRCTDNLAQGHPSAESAVEDWGKKPSVGHREQMLGFMKINGKFRDMGWNRIGVAHSGRNWIAIFGRQE